ncbi:hypothetical protein [Haloplasma contractile]|uniref:Uncharacterized protein n=1 Tax=Haloplasma contractile SSD-17B TaxID=1033810 RepID=U2FQA9_9MOLU|nr:hypothetical protein [Haloplasma contractile]ERJ13224.1 hypothetical protein HLPCO_000848 [Haloplasma contractile SSD-17B]
MKLYYSIHFFIAALIQLLVILIAELLTFTRLNINFSLFNIIVFLFMGQVCGYALLWVYQNLKLDKIATVTIILIFTLINWSLFTSINVMINQLENPFTVGFLSIIIPFIAFLVYGAYITFVIRDRHN